MSEWDNWVNFVMGTAQAKYAEKASAESPAQFAVRIGSQTDGALYAKSESFDAPLTDCECKKLTDGLTGCSMDIFGEPPCDFTIVRTIPCEGCDVLTGKSKVKAGRQLYIGQSATTQIIAVVDIENSNKGQEGVALEAFSHSICLATESGI